MKRSRSGCQTCRSRRIKCDEGRPNCNKCMKRGLHCVYGIKYQWITQDDFYGEGKPNGTKKKFASRRNNASNQTDAGSKSKVNGSNQGPKSRLGPTSRKRKIGQTAVNGSCFSQAVLKNLTTVMDEVEFDSDDEPVTVLNGPGSLLQFKKFRIRNRTDLIKRSEPPQLVAAELNSHLYAQRSSMSLAYAQQQAQMGSNMTSMYNPAAAMAHSTQFSTPASAPPSAIFVENPTLISQNAKLKLKTPLSGLSEKDFLNHFIDVTADALVPIPYEENPFLSLLPKFALRNTAVRDLLVAYGASHYSMLLHGLNSDPIDDAIVEQLISRCAIRLETLRLENTEDELALLSATILAMIKVDRGDSEAWRYFMHCALDIIQSRLTFSEWQLGVEINSMSFRLVGYMSGVGSIFSSSKEVMEFPSWPQWSGSLDYLTGIDLNLLPMFSEAAELILEVQKIELENTPDTLTRRARVNARALRIIQRMNDYWLDEFWPDSEITAMCIMFQEALQIHVLRRVLQYPTDHPIVQRIVYLAMGHLERWIPPASTIQRCMTFSLVTIASESLVAEHRTSLLIRLRHMGEAGFAYNWKVCDDIRKHWKANTSYIAVPEATVI